MLEITLLRQQPDEVAKALQKKHVADAADKIQALLDLDKQRRHTLTELETQRKEANDAAKSIGQLMKSGNKEAAEAAKQKSGALKQSIKAFEQQRSDIESAIEEQLLALPNIPHTSVPEGKKPEDNVVVHEKGNQVSFDFAALPHWELARKHDIIDWELGVKLTGAGFPVYKKEGAALQRAMINFFLDRAREAGYQEVQPPLLVNEASARGTGALPDKEGQMYYIQLDNFYLIPTAEVPITNLWRGDIVATDSFPLKACGYTPCFRREAGSYGKDVKGLNRLHQFDKVEIVQITHPDKSYEAQEEMTAYAESLLEALELPYRRLLLCGGDMSFTSAKTYDLEVYSAGQERWLEVSSVSNFETYQTNRLKLRFKGEDKKTHLAHSLNGSALALPRIVAALLENHQQADGSIRIPDALRPYTRFDQIG
ncbi:MAG: serine--tRNA ligase [Bacteroidota bacterium]